MSPLMLVLLTQLSASPAAPLATRYGAALTAGRDTAFTAPAPQVLERACGLMADLARAAARAEPDAAWPSDAAARARALGLELTASSDEGGRVWVLAEPAGLRAGAGFYALRPGGAPICIQSPHALHDRGTGELGLRLFASMRASCFFSNTLHRKAPSARPGAADVAHSPQTLFAAMTRGLLTSVGWPLVQVHGFAEGSAAAAAIVSDGTRRPGTAGPAARLASLLEGPLDAGPVLLYGRGASVLGATTNVQGREARAAGVPFLHVELSADARRRLAANPEPLVSALRRSLELP